MSLTDFFGSTTSHLRRLREIKKNFETSLRPCQEIVPVASAEFLTGQAAVKSGQDLARRRWMPAGMKAEKHSPG
jgi:hypothetical protein